MKNVRFLCLNSAAESTYFEANLSFNQKCVVLSSSSFYVAVMFSRPSRRSYGNMACLINAADGEEADGRLFKSAGVERRRLQKSNSDISLTSTFV